MVVRAKARLRTRARDGRGVVITGGTKGLGWCIAREFLRSGDNVVICGRDEGRVQAAVGALRDRGGPGASSRCVGMAADVADGVAMENLAEFAVDTFGCPWQWVNMAGQVTKRGCLHELTTDDIVASANANLLGPLLANRAALRVMVPHSGPENSRHIYNLGFSSWGAKLSKSAATHKSTKTGLSQLTVSMREELAECGARHVAVHQLSPGLVLTDLLLKGSTPVARRFFNALAEEPETVAASLVPQMRSSDGNEDAIEYLSLVDAVTRVVKGVPQIVNGGRFFDKEGNRVREAGVAYKENGVRVLY